MKKFKAVMFDLDDTLLDRGAAVRKMFSVITREFYSGAATEAMLHSFLKYDGNGYTSKIDSLNNLFAEFPPNFRIPDEEIYPFWNAHFSDCFSVDEERVRVVREIQKLAKTAIITNGKTAGQTPKIQKTGLDKIFDTIVISEAVGAWKPDPRIFEAALERLGAKPEEAMYIGDHLKNDIGGAQAAGICGVWFNPRGLENDASVVPFAEIGNFSQLLAFV